MEVGVTTLRFVRLTADGQHLVLADSAGTEFTIEASADLLLALRKALAPLSAASDDELRPAQIQARLRAGATVEQLVAEFGVDENRVRRFEGPVTQERAYVAQRSQRARIKGNTDEITLGDQIERLLLDRGQSAESLVWDATRGEEPFWQVSVTRGGAVAHFGFDTSLQSVWPLDDVARTLIGLAPTNSPRLVPVPAETPKVVPPKVETPQPAPVIPTPPRTVLPPVAEVPTPVAEVQLPVAETVSSFEPAAADMNQDPIEPAALLEDEVRPAAKKSKRASVPSWDEILFGGNE
jgi:hypothetical protein